VPMELKEIIVISDGKSNVGENPAKAAFLAHRKGIIVNAIGIMGSGEAEEPYIELEGIAKVGGGICDIIPLSMLDYSVQMVTMRSVQMTIERAVSRQLRNITGYSLEDMEPDSRARILEYIQRMGNEVSLKCVVAIDCSGSMKSRIKTALGSMQDLLISLKTRKGRSCLGIVAFPGRGGREGRVISGFTDDFDELTKRLKRIKVGGPTPTHAGIVRASRLFDGEDLTLYTEEGSRWQPVVEGPPPEAEEERPFIL